MILSLSGWPSINPSFHYLSHMGWEVCKGFSRWLDKIARVRVQKNAGFKGPESKISNLVKVSIQSDCGLSHGVNICSVASYQGNVNIILQIKTSLILCHVMICRPPIKKHSRDENHLRRLY